ncbi:MAG: hypothetical protein L0Y71_11590 [Gemmataceae bacterium]|nr:hypothetical protein [Gemmataceae bacterium]
MKTKMTVRCTSGREEHFEIDVYGSGKSAEFRFQEFVKDPTVLLRTASEVILIPAAAVECITLSLPEADSEQLSFQHIRMAERCSPAPGEGSA